jgi:hypothetical protein
MIAPRMKPKISLERLTWIKKEIIRVTAIARPPNLGIILEWTFLGSGRSIKPYLLARTDEIGVKRRDNPREVIRTNPR